MTLVLTRRDVAAVLTLDGCIPAVADGLRLHVEGKSIPPGALGLRGAGDGGFHVKAAGLLLSPPAVAVKVNANFPQNPQANGLPTIQGVVALFDADDGRLLALLDSSEVTAVRTAAATAVAADALARDDAAVAAICGCGRQGRVQLQALARVRAPREVRLWDIERKRAEALASDLPPGMAVRVVDSPAEAVRGADMIVTCTPSRAPFLTRDDVAPGSFVAAVGADHPHKQELAPELVASCRLVVDDAGQCASMGELHHALDAGLMTRADVHAELADVIAGRRPGRSGRDEVFVFDSTGVALWDVAAAVEAYAAARRTGRGVEVDLGA